MDSSQDDAAIISSALGLPKRGVHDTLALLADGATVPFIARYRKEATGGLDDLAIQQIADERERLGTLAARRQTILGAIQEQGLLTPELRREIDGCTTKAALEDLYLPFKKKRKTRASVARERGLGPLAQRIVEQARDGSPLAEARRYVRGPVKSAEEALAGARDIVAERLAERADVRGMLRQIYQHHGRLTSKAARGKAKEPSKYERYYDHEERLASAPSHRFLAIRRGEREGFLSVSVRLDVDRVIVDIERTVGVRRNSPWAEPLCEAIADGFKRLLAPSITTEVLNDATTRADEAAVKVFADNLRDLLMAAPLGDVPVVAIDPGFRTGCKCAAIDARGRVADHWTIHPHARGDQGRAGAARELLAKLRRHRPKAIAIGNGTAGRETEDFVRELVAEQADLAEAVIVAVPETGASVYSASELARAELPDLDVTIRGAVSIGRRLQDPLAELVKIDPKAIGVGQYQHDLPATLLERKLGEIVVSCVNEVGVELNTASPALLGYVAGIGPTLAKRIVDRRESSGPFRSRAELTSVSGLGPKTFEQCAGFLRVRDGAHALDASAVHPERYALVARMARDLGVSLADLVGGVAAARADQIDIARYVSDEVGRPTLEDIVAELRKPGRDPRSSFEAPTFRTDVREVEDLKVGMRLDGVVTNVTDFGAFVDIGVHQDGLVHVSELAEGFVRDPRAVVRVGQRVQVVVLSADPERRRIALSAKAALEG